MLPGVFPFDRLASPRAQIEKRARALFKDQADAALRELDRYSHRERDRVQGAILTLTDGSLEDLKRWVQRAISEYREVLVLAEEPGSPMAIELRREQEAWKPDQATLAETSFADLNEDPERRD